MRYHEKGYADEWNKLVEDCREIGCTGYLLRKACSNHEVILIHGRDKFFDNKHKLDMDALEDVFFVKRTMGKKVLDNYYLPVVRNNFVHLTKGY